MSDIPHQWDETAPSREYVNTLKDEITTLRVALAEERKRAQPIETAEVGQQMLAYEPDYGWLIVAKEANGSFVQKSSGNFWMDVPASVQFTHWLPYPGFLELEKPE